MREKNKDRMKTLLCHSHVIQGIQIIEVREVLMDPSMCNCDSVTAFRSVTFSGAVGPNVNLMPNSETMKSKVK